MVLLVIPSSPRNGSIVVSILTVIQFLFLIFAITTLDDFQEKLFIFMVVVFSVICIIASGFLFIGAVRLKRNLIIPYLLAMSLFVCSYAIVFVVMITSANSHTKDWIHFTILGANVCFLIAAGALYREILKAEQAVSFQVTVDPTPAPFYAY